MIYKWMGYWCNGFQFAGVDDELEWTRWNGTDELEVYGGVTPVTPGVREYGVTPHWMAAQNK
jgi:hypothetical protein